MKPKSQRPRQFTESELKLRDQLQENIQRVRVQDEAQKAEEKARYLSSVYLELRNSTGTLYCDACQGPNNILVDKNSYGRNRGLLCRSCKNLLSRVGKGPTAAKVEARAQNLQLMVKDLEIFLASELAELSAKPVEVPALKEEDLSQLLEDRTETAARRKEKILRQARVWERKAEDAELRAKRYRVSAAELRQEADSLLRQVSVQITNLQSRRQRYRALRRDERLKKKQLSRQKLIDRRQLLYQKKLSSFSLKQEQLAGRYRLIYQYLSKVEGKAA